MLEILLNFDIGYGKQDNVWAPDPKSTRTEQKCLSHEDWQCNSIT